MVNRSLFTMLLAIAIAQFSILTVQGADGLQKLPPHDGRRDLGHIDLGRRMIKKRRPQGDTPINVPADPEDDPQLSTRTTVTGTTSPAQTRSNTPSQTPSQPGGNTASTPSGTTSTPSSTSSSSTSSSTSSSSTSTASASSSESSTRSSTRSTATRTVLASASSTQTELPPAQDPDNSFLSKSAIIGLIVAGSCIAGGAAIWTVIRKWKFSPSRHFEDRLEPVNWEPTQSSGLPHDPTVAALHRGTSQTGGSRRASGDDQASIHMTTVSGHNQPPVSMTPDFPPPHDFTAGPSNGYVDMYRGPSPGPNNAYAASHYETPNPYDAYDYNNTAAYGQRRY
ncbi:hypothetical protein FRC19_001066 [Serendipita sp. 401]|nr:hypothetical protein FRC19_001066 [Serendipita sp. 401]KAG9048792.1 hypothetical protein FS842_000311 [Serendipita sp. 407]